MEAKPVLLRRLDGRRGQSIVEYLMVVGAILLALAFMMPQVGQSAQRVVRDFLNWVP